MTYAEYAQRGAYPLVISALLAGFFMLITFRVGGAAEKSRLAVILVALWVVQNNIARYNVERCAEVSGDGLPLDWHYRTLRKPTRSGPACTAPQPRQSRQREPYVGPPARGAPSPCQPHAPQTHTLRPCLHRPPSRGNRASANPTWGRRLRRAVALTTARPADPKRAGLTFTVPPFAAIAPARALRRAAARGAPSLCQPEAPQTHTLRPCLHRPPQLRQSRQREPYVGPPLAARRRSANQRLRKPVREDSF